MKLRTSQKAAYSFGAFGKDLVYMLISGYLLYYYNAVLGMDSAFIGTVLMAARVFDAINDPFMGIIVAKTRTKWGQFRPWIFAGTILNAVTIYALYATPDSLSDSEMRIWLTVFYFAWGITYTLMDIPFWSLIPAVTEPGEDREQLSSFARGCAGIGDAIPTVLTMIIVAAISNSQVEAEFKVGFKYWALIIAIIFVISEIICVVSIKEKSLDSAAPAIKIGDMFKSLFKNDQAIVVVISIILVYTALNLCSNLVLYFFNYDIGDPAYLFGNELNSETAYSVFAGVAFLAQIIVIMTVPALRKKYSKHKLFIFGFVAQIVGFAVIFLLTFTPVCSSELWAVFCIPGMLIYAGYGILNVIMTIFLSDSVDYGEYKNGTREEAIIFSMQTFTVKLASGLAVFVAGLVLKWINLDVRVHEQADSTLLGLRLWMTIPSIILLLIGIYVYKNHYKLTEDKMQEINEAIHSGK